MFLSGFKDLKNPYIILLLNNILGSFAIGFVPLFFRTHDYPLFSLIFIYLGWSFIGALIIPFLNVVRIRLFLILAMFIYMAMLTFLTFSAPKFSFFTYVISSGLLIGLFWVPLNYLFFSSSGKNTHATTSSLYFIVGPLVAMVFPGLGALVIKYKGFSGLFILAALFCLIPLFFIIKKTPEQTLKYSFLNSFKEYDGLKIITFFEGALHFFIWGIIPVYILLFLKTEIEVGGFMAYLGFLGVAVAVFFILFF